MVRRQRNISTVTDGARGFGDAVGIIDEAKAECALSFESRAYCDIDYHGIELSEKVEGMDTEDLETFLEGFAQGAMCTLHIDLVKVITDIILGGNIP